MYYPRSSRWDDQLLGTSVLTRWLYRLAGVSLAYATMAAMASERIPVVPEVLAWAGRTARLSVEAAAKRVGASAASIERWEAGELQPTIKQLRNAARVYGRPLAVLLLPEPSLDFQPLADFRRTGDDGTSGEWSPALVTGYRRAVSQREVLLEIAALSPDRSEPTDITIAADQSADQAAEVLRELLGFDDLPPGLWARPRELLRAAIDAVEALDVVVIHTGGVEPAEMRGFSIAERPFPLIALNGKDWPRPRLFTLLHELTHVALSAGGVCDLHETPDRQATGDQLEHYCNAVAAALLMPAEAFERAAAEQPGDWTLNELEALSQRFGSSSEAVLLRLVSIGRASWDDYYSRRIELHEQYDAARKRERQRQREAEGGPSYYVVKARDLGHAYVTQVFDAFRSRVISSLDVADYLDVRYDQLAKLEDVVSR